LPTLLLRKDALTNPESQLLVDRIDAGLTPETLPDVVAALRAHPAAQQANLEAQRWAAQAIEAIAPLPEGPVKQALSVFAQAVVDRQQ
jgi:heptaprenyl diphosphate synthase